MQPVYKAEPDIGHFWLQARPALNLLMLATRPLAAPLLATPQTNPLWRS